MIAYVKNIATAAVIVLSATHVVHAEIEVQEVISEGGINAWLVEEHSIPFTALEIRFKGGTSLDRDGKRGETNLMMATLEEGAAGLDAQGFAQARDSLAAHFSFSGSMDTLSISARFLSENRDASLALLRTAIMEPSFDAVAVERVRGQIHSLLQSNVTSPDELAAEALFAQAFGSEHPYGTVSDGTFESVAGLTPEDLVEARLRGFAKDRLYVSAVGDITAQELSELLDDLLGDLPETGAAMPERITPNLTGGVDVVPFETPQSLVMFGHQGITRNHENFMEAYIANEVFAGSRESRLMQEVREKRGLTYGIGVSLAPMDHSELILGRFSSGNEVVAQAVDVVQDEWRKFAEHGITAAELSDAKTYLTGAYALRFDGNAPIASILVGMQMVGLEPDYIAHRNELVDAVTLDEINTVIAELYKPEDLSFFVVGEPVGLETE